ncbi:MAG: glycosyltransferase family 2 protein [Aquisalimonadaceae bacterium]
MMAWLFWSCAVLFLYVYVGYPLVLALWSRGKGEHPRDPACTPPVTIIIAAYNEASYIADKVKNALASDYPPDRLQVIVVSDGSDDGTVQLVREITDPRLRFLELPRRRGKANALNAALGHATGRVLIFTDANVFFQFGAVRRLAGHFRDPDCGCVTGRVDLLPMGAGEPLGEGAYMRFERWLQARESAVATVVGTDGALFAVRRELVQPLPEGIVLDDFLIAMRVADQGRRTYYDHAATAVERVPASVSQEFRRKVRIAAGGFQVLPLLGFLRRPLDWPALWFCFVSHKLLRWLSPWWMLGLLVSSAALTVQGQMLYMPVLLVQLLLYGLALTAWLSGSARRFGVFYVPYYFTAVNLALLFGLQRHFLGGQSVIWQRVNREKG